MTPERLHHRLSVVWFTDIVGYSSLPQVIAQSEEADRLREMFDAVATELTAEDLEDRDLILGAFSDRE